MVPITPMIMMITVFMVTMVVPVSISALLIIMSHDLGDSSEEENGCKSG
jgi:hypothetical protein